MGLRVIENNGLIPLPAGVANTPGWYPRSPQQLSFLLCRAELALYGGASGGGKSNVLVADSAQEFDNPRFRGILLRKSYTEMTSLMDEMESIYRPLGARPSDGRKLWRFPAGGIMRLGYMASDKDLELYTGKPISWLGIDEAQFQTERRVRTLFPWVATPPEYGLRDRIRLTANPSNPWLKKLFLNNECPICHPERATIPCAVYEGARWIEEDGPVMKTTCFIPAKLEDNPLYDERKKAALMSQTDDIQKKLLLGHWCATEGSFLPFFDESYFAPYSDCGEEWWHAHFLSMDYGFSNSAAATGLYFINEHGRIYKVMEDIERKMYSEEYAHHIANRLIMRKIGHPEQRIKIIAGYADSAMDAHTGNTGRSNLEIINAVLEKYDVHLISGSKSPVASAQLLAGKLKRREFVITDSCPRTFECWSSRKSDPDRPGAVLKVPGDELDDICLVGGTQVMTVEGNRSIEHIVSGDRVLTRKGSRRVLWSGTTSPEAPTLTVTFSNGDSISGTPNHPVYVAGKGFIRLDSMQYGDNVVSCSEFVLSKKSSIAESLFAAIHSASNGASAAILCLERAIDCAVSRICTGRFTRTISGRSRLVMSSTIRTKMPLITIPETRNYSPGQTTQNTMCGSAWPIQNIWQRRRPMPMQSGIFRSAGIHFRRAASGIPRTLKGAGLLLWKPLLYVSNAALRSLAFPGWEGSAFFVQQHVRPSGGEGLVSMMRLGIANDALPTLSSTDTKIKDSAPVSVLRVTTGPKSKVYNLSVEGEQEFFANGILVHNCDSDLYGLNNFCQGNQKPASVATAEKIHDLKEKGVDDRSLAVIKWKMDQAAAKAAKPPTMGRPTIGRAVFRR